MQKIGELLRKIQVEISSMVSTFKDKGAHRFSRPLLLGIFAVFAANAALYKPATRKLAGLQKRIDAVRATIQYAEQYTGLRDQLKAAKTRLPEPAGRGAWLTNAVVEAMKEESVIADSIEPPQESPVNSFYQQKVNISVRTRFPLLAGVMHRLETTKPLIHIHSLTIVKGSEEEGFTNRADIGVSTLVPQ